MGFNLGSAMSFGISDLGKHFSKQWNLRGLNDIWDDFTGNSAIDKQNEYNIQMWNMQNEYNTPANQMKRYREAGLNPNLIYGNGTSSAGNAGSAPTMQAHQGSASKFLDLVHLGLQLKNMWQQNKNLSAQTDDIKAQTLQRKASANYDNAVLDFYKKHGYFPGQSAVPTNIVKEVANHPFVQHSADAIGTAVGKVVGSLTTNVDNSPDRAMRMAIQVADKRGLTGQARVNFINKFIEIYNRAH